MQKFPRNKTKTSIFFPFLESMRNVTLEKIEEKSYSATDSTQQNNGIQDLPGQNGQDIVANRQFTFWETLTDPRKLFPTLDPMAGIIVYVAIILLFALFLLLLIWIITVWCLECRTRRKKRRYHGNLLAHDLFSHSLSSFGSIGSLSTMTSSTYGNNSLSKLVKSPKHGKNSQKFQQTCSSRLRPLSCGANRCPSCAAFDVDKKKQLKRVKSRSEKAQLLRHTSSLYKQRPTSFLQRNPSHLSSSSGLEKGLCRNCYTETCFGRACELPRANWDSENIISFIKDHAVKAKTPETPAPDYGTVIGQKQDIGLQMFEASVDTKSNQLNTSTLKVDTSALETGENGVVNDGYVAEFPPPPFTKT